MNVDMAPTDIEVALAAVGELLMAEGERHAVVVVGGATMNLLGHVHRTTRDVDVIARASRDDEGHMRLQRAEPLPSALKHAIRTVARDFGLADAWMNSVVESQWSQGLPPGTAGNITWRNYGGGLDVGLVGRRTLIALKLFAAVDRGPQSVHVQDLIALTPSHGELDSAAEWVRTQDAAAEWPALIEEVIEHVTRSDS